MYLMYLKHGTDDLSYIILRMVTEYMYGMIVSVYYQNHLLISMSHAHNH